MSDEHLDDSGAYSWDAYLGDAGTLRRQRDGEVFLEPAHPNSCHCSFCSPRKSFDIEHQASEEARVASEPLPEPSTDIKLLPWYEDVRELARLLRWIALRDIEISDIPSFLEAPRTWEREYEHMLAAEKRGPRTLG